MASNGSDAIQSYITYFNDIKPYHTKILEVLEQYNFTDEIKITVDENIRHNYKLANKELCDSLELFEDYDEGFDFNKRYVIIGYDYSNDQVFLDGDVTSDFSQGDAIALLNSSLDVRPVITEVTAINYNSSANRTEIDVSLNINSGEYDSYTRLGKDFCNLFDPIAGGFGFMFDDDQIVSQATFATTPSSGQTQVVLSGNYSYDRRFQIKSIPNTTTVLIEGDITSLLSSIDSPVNGTNTAFRIVNKRTYDIQSCTSNTLSISGDHVNDILRTQEFNILGTGVNDGRFSVISAVYDGINNLTEIKISATQTIDTDYCDGIVSISKTAKNLGFYLISSATFNGINTLVTLDSTTPLDFTDVTEAGNHGTLMLRTAMSDRRIVSLNGTKEVIDKQYTNPNSFEDKLRSGETAGSDYDFDAAFTGFDWIVFPATTTQTNFDYIVNNVTYDPSSDETTVELRGEIPTTVTSSTLDLIGNFGIGGFDGIVDTNNPKDVHIYTNFRESLSINVFEGPPPSLTPAATPQATPGLTPTPTATLTPTLTVTPSVTPTLTVTPSGTPPLVVLLSGFTTGGTGGPLNNTSNRVRGFPFASPFTTASGTGDLIAGRRRLHASSTDRANGIGFVAAGRAGRSIHTYRYGYVNFNTGTYGNNIGFFEPSNGNYLQSLSGTQSESTSYFMGGYSLRSDNLFNRIVQHPMSAPFAPSSTAGTLNEPRRSQNGGVNDDSTGYFMGNRTGGTTGVGNTVSTTIQSFPFSSPFSLSTTIGDLNTDNLYNGAAASDTSNAIYMGGNTGVSPSSSKTTNVQSFPFTSPFTTSTSVGDLTNAVALSAGISSNTDGYAAGSGQVLSFPFAATSTVGIDVGDITPGFSQAGGHEAGI